MATVTSGYNERTEKEVVDDSVYNGDTHNPERDQFVWVTRLVIAKSEGLFPIQKFHFVIRDFTVLDKWHKNA